MSGLLVALFLLLIIEAAIAAPTEERDPKVQTVVILIDGFRHDYAIREAPKDVPAFTRMAENGARAEYVQTIYPSLSMPTWTSMVTGLYAEEHGMVGNNIYDPVTKKVWGFGAKHYPENRDPVWYKDHEPLFVSAAAQGKRVSMYYWGYCSVPYTDTNGNRVKFETCKDYTYYSGLSTVPVFKENLAKVADELATGVDAVFLYCEVIDATGHSVGPDAEELRQKVKEVDGELLTFFNNLASAGLLNTTNIIIISDHGMTSSENVKKHKVADYVDISKLEKVVERGAYMVVKVKKGVNIAEVVAEFNKIEGATAYAKADVPDYMKFKNHDKLLDILVFADGVGNYIWGDLKDNDDEEVFIPPVTSEPSLKGNHGWDDTSPDAAKYMEGREPDMRGVFYAMGPSFKPNHTNQWVKMVDEYQLMAYAMGTTPVSGHHGNWDRVKEMVTGSNANSKTSLNAFAILFISLMLFVTQ